MRRVDNIILSTLLVITAIGLKFSIVPKNYQNVSLSNINTSHEFNETVYRADLYDATTEKLVCKNCEVPHNEIIKMLEQNKKIVNVDISDHSTTFVFAFAMFFVVIAFSLYGIIDKILLNN